METVNDTDRTARQVIEVIRGLRRSGAIGPDAVAAMQKGFVVAYARQRGSGADVLRAVGNGLAGV